MPPLAATNVTVTVLERWIQGKKRYVRGTMNFGNGSDLTYPTGGVPLPSISAFGFSRNIDGLTVYGLNALTTDYMVRYSPATHRLLMYEEEAVAAGGPLLECDTSELPPNRTYTFLAWGW